LLRVTNQRNADRITELERTILEKDGMIDKLKYR